MYYNFDGTPLIKPCNEPYNDDFMTFDSETRRYVLTENDLLQRCGINLRARFEGNRTIVPEVMIQKLCRIVSDMIYEWIHGYSIYNDRQDYLIATIPKMRQVIQKAMEYQIEYFLANGDLFLSTENNERGKEISKLAQNILLNSGICYSGV